MKVVINKCYGGFGLSEAAYEALRKRGWSHAYVAGGGPGKNGPDLYTYRGSGYESLNGTTHYNTDRISELEFRSHPDVVAVVEELGDAASGMLARLRVVEIPDGIEWEIDNYDGIESVEEVHRSWG